MMTKEYSLYHRPTWSPRDPKPMTPQARITEGFLHHSEDASGAVYDTLAKQKAKMRDIQNFHMDVRGWSDIAYAYLIFQPNHRHHRAHIFEGRLTAWVPAAQLGHNTGTLPICVVGNGDTEALHPNTQAAIRALLQWNHIQRFGGHRDVVATDCPGRRFYPEVAVIAKAVGIPHF